MAALSITELQHLRDELVRARLSGLREIVDSNGERISYKSDGEMARALADVESRISAMQSAAPTTIRFQTSKGT